MHALPILKQACLEAIETDGEPGDPGRFFSIVDPGSVLELIQIAETHITDEEVQALHHAIGPLSDYIRRASPTPEAIELVRHAKAVVGVTIR
jgi:hypothetical protein